MNILFITHYSSLYGANRSLLLLMEGLKKNNINPMVFVPDEGSLIGELKRCNIAYHKIKFWAWMGVEGKLFIFKAVLRFLLNLASLPILLVYATKFKPSIIYSNSSITPIGIYLSILLRKPHIWHIRELGKLDYNLEYDFGRKYFYYFMRKSDAIISISQCVKESLFKGDWKNISIINNAVYSDDDVDSLNANAGIRKDKAFIFLIMSIVHPSKGIHDAIEAIGKIKKDINTVKLIICGGDEDKQYRKYLNSLVIKLDLVEQVLFKGFIDKPLEMYKAADAILVCSRNEAWGRVAAEAMISEKPVIGYNSCGTKEIIADMQTGLLYNNIEELSSCMKKVILDRELVNSMVNNAKTYALQSFSMSETAGKVFKTIKVLK
ncbi:MAG: glycosyltransferase family 4 protein [Ignavibacteriaceae bacterium]|nr:glycosyltransferase family 4 protein [Ignavibacteriaceae bacterium]